jgi:hypothetical protein
MALVSLDASAIKLELEGGWPQQLEGLGNGVHGFRQHGEHWPKQLEAIVGKRSGAVGEHRSRDLGQAPGHHHCMPDRRRGTVSRARDRLDQDPLERSLPEISREQSPQEILLGRRAPGKQLHQEPYPLACTSDPGYRPDRPQGSVNIAELECCSTGGCCR